MKFPQQALKPLLVAALAASACSTTTAEPRGADDRLDWVRNVVVIYMENHSFDNLYGLWEPVHGEPVDGLVNAKPKHTLQIGQNGAPYNCLLQDDPHLTAPSPLPTTCVDNTTGTAFNSAFLNRPFQIDHYIPNVSLTRDLVHRFYQEQYQLNHGQQNRYVTGSDAVGLSMGYYDTRKLPVYQYLHGHGAPHYVVLDNFFQAAFGGSFLNHQWLVAARTPTWNGAVNDGGANDVHSVVDADGMPSNYPLYKSPLGTEVKDKALTASCKPPAGRPAAPAGAVCGDYAINTVQPWNQPYAPGTANANRLPPLTYATIGQRLSEAGIDWAWYSGGWSNAAGNVGQPGWTNGTASLPPNATSAKPCPDTNAIPAAIWPNCPDKLFQFHHQALNYFAGYAPGSKAREEHLRDEAEFIQMAKNGQLKAVSFVKPIGEENEHPGYASVQQGSQHLKELLEALANGPQAMETLVIVTYDEFGGSWDHVPPPGQGHHQGVHDQFGPGTRVPALLVSRRFSRSSVDHTPYDTTSILATIERRFGLLPVGGAYAGAPRDARVHSLARAIRIVGE